MHQVGFEDEDCWDTNTIGPTWVQFNTTGSADQINTIGPTRAQFNTTGSADQAVPVNLGIICNHKFESTYEELFSKDEVGKEERKLGLYDEETSEFFDIPYDLNDNYSHFVLV